MSLLRGKVSCIIPFYNERRFIRNVLEIIKRTEGISQVICVDDGSTDNTSEVVAAFPEVKLITLDRNYGKSYAVKRGLEEVVNEYVLLVDADLKDLDEAEIGSAINAITGCSAIDMIILRRTNSPWFIKMYRIDTLLSGERLLRTDDLKHIFRNKVKGYQLEIAINLYMYRNKKKVFWSPSSALNTFKLKKLSSFRAIAKEMSMYASIVQHAGLINLLGLLTLFGKKKIGTEQRPGFPPFAGTGADKGIAANNEQIGRN